MISKTPVNEEILVIDEFIKNLSKLVISVDDCKLQLNYMATHGEFSVSVLVRSHLDFIKEKYSLNRKQIEIILSNSPLK